MLRPYITTDQISYPTQVTGTLLADGRGKQNRPLGVHTRACERLANRDERGEAARIVGDAGSLEPQSAARDRDIEFRTEDRIEVGAEHNAVVSRFPFPAPATYVADSVNRDVVQASVTEHLRHTPAACGLRTGGCRDRRQRGLAGERHLVGTLDMRACGADPVVREKCGNHAAKL